MERLLRVVSACVVLVLTSCSGESPTRSSRHGPSDLTDGGDPAQPPAVWCGVLPPDLCGSWTGVAHVASKSYKPPQWQDAEHCFCRAIPFSLPEAIPVTSGNAGNHQLRLIFADSTGQDGP